MATPRGVSWKMDARPWLLEFQPISGLHPDGYLSKSISYIKSYPDGYSKIIYNESYPDGYPSGSVLKDGGSPTMTAQWISGPCPDGYVSKSITYITLMATENSL